MDHIFTQENRRFVSKSLQTRTILFLGIAIALFVFMLYDIVTGEAPWWMAIGAFIVGGVIGYVYGRVSRLRWHESEEKIVRQNDVLGFILIAAYVAFGYARDALLKDFLSGGALIAVSLAVASGILLGRFLGMHTVMLRMIRERASR